MSVPTIAVFLLERFCRDQALVGDILEEFEHRQSRAWLWRQVAVVVLLGLPYGLMKEPPTSGRMPMPVGGIGLLAATGLVTIVAPGAWWVGAIAVGGGVVLGAAMILASRRRVLKAKTRRNILLPLLLAAAVADAAAQPQPTAAVRIDPVDGIVEALKTHQVVMLPGGHGSKPFHDLLLAVVRDPRMPGTLTDIVVEFGKIPEVRLEVRWPFPEGEWRVLLPTSSRSRPRRRPTWGATNRSSS